MAEYNPTRIFKGFARLGSFPLDLYSVFKSEKALRSYVLGANGKSLAYKGQILSALNIESGLFDIYVINEPTSSEENAITKIATSDELNITNKNLEELKVNVGEIETLLNTVNASLTEKVDTNTVSIGELKDNFLILEKKIQDVNNDLIKETEERKKETSELSKSVDNLKTDLNDLNTSILQKFSDYPTKQEVQEKIDLTSQSISIIKDTLIPTINSNIENIQSHIDILEKQHANYAEKDYVLSEIAKAQLNGQVDTSIFAKATDLQNVSNRLDILVNSASEEFDTLHEIEDRIKEDRATMKTLEEALNSLNSVVALDTVENLDSVKELKYIKINSNIYSVPNHVDIVDNIIKDETTLTKITNASQKYDGKSDQTATPDFEVSNDVGGLKSGTNIEGKTVNEILNMILSSKESNYNGEIYFGTLTTVVNYVEDSIDNIIETDMNLDTTKIPFSGNIGSVNVNITNKNIIFKTPNNITVIIKNNEYDVTDSFYSKVIGENKFYISDPCTINTVYTIIVKEV